MPNAAFTALVTDVYSITKRPDYVAETSVAVRAATLKLHQMEYFPRDLFETKINFTVADYFQTISHAILFPRMRALSYIRKFENGAPTELLDIIEPTNLFDSYSVSKENVCYLAGASIQIRSNTQISSALIGVFQNPVTDPETYASWIATLYPFAVIYEAAAEVFNIMGFDEQAQRYRALANEQKLSVKNSNILAEGW